MNRPIDAPFDLAVDLGDRSYQITIGDDVLGILPTILDRLQAKSVIPIITDEHVHQAHGAYLQGIIAAAQREAHVIVLPAGEQTKNWHQLGLIVEELLSLNLGRKDPILAFGGGVVGDITGFAASMLKRGCPFIQIPTTLLAQVDSSVGGKTGINSPLGKNLIGAFHQPAHVLIDTTMLKTLPRRELQAGYAEIIKYGLIDDEPFFAWLEQHGPKILQLAPNITAEAIARSCQAKARIVAADETEQDARALLNLGHSFGHALEAVNGYDGKLLHGEAVAIGMIAALRFSVGLGLAPSSDLTRVEHHVTQMGMRALVHEAVPEGVTAETLMAAMMQDKKNMAGQLVLILMRGIGQSFIDRKADAALVQKFWGDCLSHGW